MSKSPALPDPDKWEEVISMYEEMAHPFTSHFARAAIEAVKLREGEKVLDIATGMGAVALVAADHGAEVTAIDFTPGMIKRVKAAGRPNIDAHVMNGEALSFGDGEFDVTLSVFGIMLFEDWRKGLLEMARVTRPLGRTAMATWKDVRGAAINLLLFRIIEEKLPHVELPPPPDGMASLSDPDALSREMQRAGFQAPRIYEITHDFELKLEKLAEKGSRLFGVAGVWEKLSETEQQTVLDEFHLYAEKNAQDGILPIPSTCLLAIAEKP